MLFFFVKSLFKPKLDSLNTIQIHRANILHNLEVLQNLQPESAIFPVLKSNAYGHGLKEVATILKSIDLPYICVDSVPEYYLVKKFAKKRSLIIGETLPSNYKKLHHKRATPCIYTLASLQALIESWKPWKIHLFLNTWMNREWIQYHELWGFLELLQWSKIELEWVMSHFANADEVDSNFCLDQIAEFKQMYSMIEQYGFTPKYKHIANTAWIAKIQDPFFTASRTWIGLFGYSPLVKEDPSYDKLASLKPSLDVKTTLVSMQRIKSGDIASYGGTFIANQDTTVATLPFGYTEGLSRSLRGKRHVMWQEKELPVIGTICMNLCIIDTLWENIKVGDQVTIISSNLQHPNTIQEFAKLSGTINYEVLVNLDPKARRTIV